MKKGFTLIELLIVVAIIGILAAIAVPNFMNAQTRAMIARVRADTKSLTTALEQYRMDRNTYPIDWGGPVVEDRSWAQLTTPVAYISSTSICKDPFTDSLAGAIGGSHAGHRVFYDYGGGVWHGSLNEGDARRRLYEEESRVGFIILSFGPNKSREFPWGTQNVINIGKRNADGLRYVYDASNGIKSPGDIIATRSGPIQ